MLTDEHHHLVELRRRSRTGEREGRRVNHTPPHTCPRRTPAQRLAAFVHLLSLQIPLGGARTRVFEHHFGVLGSRALGSPLLLPAWHPVTDTLHEPLLQAAGAIACTRECSAHEQAWKTRVHVRAHSGGHHAGTGANHRRLHRGCGCDRRRPLRRRRQRVVVALGIAVERIFECTDTLNAPMGATARPAFPLRTGRGPATGIWNGPVHGVWLTRAERMCAVRGRRRREV